MIQTETSIFGIDFDNTIVCYDEVIHRKAVEWGLIDVNFSKNKKLIRDAIRQLEDGEMTWQKLQAYIYGEGMGEARLIDEAATFIKSCLKSDIDVFIVSHKTEFANMIPNGINLREQALNWMAEKNFFKQEGLGLKENQVYFESTRAGKCQRIKDLNCTHFVDDLLETFEEPSFPKDVTKILYAPDLEKKESQAMTVFNQWKDINECYFS